MKLMRRWAASWSRLFQDLKDDNDAVIVATGGRKRVVVISCGICADVCPCGVWTLNPNEEVIPMYKTYNK